MPKKLPRVGRKGNSLKNSIIPPKPVNNKKQGKSKDAIIIAENNISPCLGKYIGLIEKFDKKVKQKQRITFLEKLPGKIKKPRGGKKQKKSKKRRGSSKKEKKPKKKRAPRPSRPKAKQREYPEFITAQVSKDRGIADSFLNRAGLDPRFSVKDRRFEEVGKGGGSYVKQEQRRFHFTDWNHAKSHQRSDWAHIIWLDPSAPSAIIHPAHLFVPKKVKVVKGKCPTKIDLAKEFGKEVEFIYMSPPWDSPNFGNGKRGYFTLKHLERLNLEKVHEKGFIFMWLPFLHIWDIKLIMEEKGYGLVDSCGAILTNFAGEILTRTRNPHAKKNSNNPEDLIGRTAGFAMKGVLWKKLSGKGKERFRIGNQIIYDCFQWRKKTDQFTGQFLPDHGYGYEMYQYLICQKPEKKNVIHALHLWCRPGLKVKNFGGVEYFPEYDYKKGCLKSEI